jgi:hypothetical protein
VQPIEALFLTSKAQIARPIIDRCYRLLYSFKIVITLANMGHYYVLDPLLINFFYQPSSLMVI